MKRYSLLESPDMFQRASSFLGGKKSTCAGVFNTSRVSSCQCYFLTKDVATESTSCACFHTTSLPMLLHCFHSRIESGVRVYAKLGVCCCLDGLGCGTIFKWDHLDLIIQSWRAISSGWMGHISARSLSGTKASMILSNYFYY